MKRLNVQNDILPLTEFRAKMAELIERMTHNRSPLVLTQHGRAVAVVIPPADYEEFAYRDEFVKAVREGIAELDAGKGVPHEDVVAYFDSKYAAHGGLKGAAAKELTDEEYHEVLTRADQAVAAKQVRATKARKAAKA